MITRQLLRPTLLIAAIYASLTITIDTVEYLSDQMDFTVSNLGTIRLVLLTGGVIIAFRKLIRPLQPSIGQLMLSVFFVMIVSSLPIIAFRIGLYHYIDIDYQTRIATQQIDAYQKKIHQVEAEKNVIFVDDSADRIQQIKNAYSIKGLVRTQALSVIFLSVLLTFLVLLVTIPPATHENY